MSNQQLQEYFAETVSAVNASNGVVRMFFAGQQLDAMAEGDESQLGKAENRFCVTLTLPGFLYAMSVCHGLIENPQFQEVVEKVKAAGLLPPES